MLHGSAQFLMSHCVGLKKRQPRWNDLEMPRRLTEGKKKREEEEKKEYIIYYNNN